MPVFQILFFENAAKKPIAKKKTSRPRKVSSKCKSKPYSIKDFHSDLPDQIKESDLSFKSE